MGHVPLKRKGNTFVRHEENDTVVRYHHTDIVRFDEYRVLLNSNGWRTSTTKARMNQTASENDLGFQVYQERHVWYVWMSGMPHDARFLFRDGMEIPRRDR